MLLVDSHYLRWIVRERYLLGVVGWNSLEESEKARGTKNLGVDGTVEVHHVNFRFPIKGFRGL